MKRFNRRQFNQQLTAAAAATGIVAGYHTSGRARAADAPADKIGVAVCGVNGRGMSHVGALINDPRSVIRVLVDIDEKVGNQRADQVAEKQGSRPEVLIDIREALQRPDIDVITSAAPNHWHALMGVWAMAAGKDVYIEKPISHNVEEGRSLVAAAKKYGRMFQTGTQCRSSPAIQEAMAYIADGKIGECNFARGLCYKRRKSIGPLGDYAIPGSVDFDLWSGPAELTDPRLTRQQFHYDWHWQRMYGNGDSGNQGPHQTDVARWGLGLQRHPRAVMTYGGRLGYKAERKDPSYVDAGDTANTQVSLYDYGDKSIVFETRGLDVSNSADEEINRLFGYDKGNKIGVIFYGSDGYLVQTSYTTCLAFDKDMNQVEKFKHSGKALDDLHFSNFLDAVVSRDESKLKADARCGHLSASIAHLGNTSYYLGQANTADAETIAAKLGQFASLDDSVETLGRTLEHLRANGVDLTATPLSLGPILNFSDDQQRYVDNDDANDYLTRAYRKGYEVPLAEQV